ncbi:MAG: FecR domain-containing protein [Spirochaetales bacterium]
MIDKSVTYLFRFSPARLLAAAGLLLVFSGVLGAQEDLAAVFEEVEGTVEIQLPGESWESVEVGDAVPVEARVSTGFGATAVIAVGENSTITVDSLTRVGIRELAREEGVERSSMDLEIGRIDGEVQGADAESTEVNVRSPVATASVRGTSFGFDGERLWVGTGSVSLSNSLGQQTTVNAGEESSTNGVSAPQEPAQARASRGEVSYQTRGGGEDRPRRNDRSVQIIEDPAIINLTGDFK